MLLGGVSIFGGSGTLSGVGLSILVILNLRNGMGLANITGNTQTGVIGLLLILSVLVRTWPQGEFSSAGGYKQSICIYHLSIYHLFITTPTKGSAQLMNRFVHNTHLPRRRDHEDECLILAVLPVLSTLIAAGGGAPHGRAVAPAALAGRPRAAKATERPRHDGPEPAKRLAARAGRRGHRQPAKLNMVLLPKFLGILPFDQAHQGAHEAEKELQNPTSCSSSGRRLRTASPGQIEIVTNATTQGVNAIMISNNSGDQIVPAAKAAGNAASRSSPGTRRSRRPRAKTSSSPRSTSPRPARSWPTWR